MSKPDEPVFGPDEGEDPPMVENVEDELRPLPVWQREELDRRMANLEKVPAVALEWHDVVRLIRNRNTC
jgi:hypothetical protein